MDFVSSRELFSGVGDGKFPPEETLTRAMLLTVLARLNGVDTDGGPTWYQKGVEWAVAQGVSDGSAPEAELTREQFVTMLYRCAGSPAAAAQELPFSDADAVSGYALDAMRWAVESGVIGGHGDGTIEPGGNATRAQAATMLMKFVELLHQ